MLAHELGHVIGLGHGASELMDEVIEPGHRELPLSDLNAQSSVAAPSEFDRSVVAMIDPIRPNAAVLPMILVVSSRAFVEIVRPVGVPAIDLDVATARTLADRAVKAIEQATPKAGDSRVPLAPMSMWWLMIGVGVALAALRRGRLLHAARR